MYPVVRHPWFRIGIAVALLPILPAGAKDKKAKPAETKDSIEVIGHLALTQTPAVRLSTAIHWRRNYLYIEYGPERAITVADVTDPRAPKATAEFVPPSGSTPLYISAVEGNAAMFTGTPPAPHVQAPESVTIVSYDDPTHPKIVRQFSRVSCLLNDSGRGVIYLTNDEGLWVLRSRSAPDRELEEEYDHYIRYSH